MPTEQDPETADESAGKEADEEPESNEDESSDSDSDADEDTSEGDASASAEGSADGSTEDVPRNRAERRAKERRERKGVRPNRSDSDVIADRIERRRVPARTISGKSSSDEVPPWARDFVDRLSRHRGVIAAGVLLVLGAVGGSIGWVMYQAGQEAKAAGSFYDALEIATGTVRAADAPPEPPNAPPHRGPTYPDYAARSRAALEALQRVTARYPTAPVGPLARLSQAGVLYDLGRFAEAKSGFESLIGTDVAGQEGRVLENLGYTLEAMNDLPGALRRFEELGRLQDGAWRDTAQLHQARILIKQNQNQRAIDLLHTLITRVGRTTGDDTTAVATSNTSVHEEAQGLLHDVAPEDPMGRRTEDPNAALRRMIEQQMRMRGGRGAAPPPGEP